MPLLTRLSPGLSSTEIDELVAPLELQVPDEAKLWWGWHDGVPAHAVTRDSERWLGPGRAFIPLAEAVEQYRQRLQIAHHLATDSGLPDHDADSWWSREWFPITGSEIGIACDCSASADAPTPIRAIHWHTMRLEELRTIRAPSLGELVGWWIEAFDVGAWDYDPARDQWDYQYERLSRARQLAVLL